MSVLVDMPEDQSSQRLKNSVWPGIGLTLALAFIAQIAGDFFPVIGAPIIGIVLGVIYRNVFNVPAVLLPGIAFSSKKILQWSIIALGFGLNLKQVLKTGTESLAVTLVTLVAAFFSVWLMGRLLRITPKLKLLIGVGTAICGGSAIAAVTSIVKSDEHETSLSISTIFLFNVLAVLIFPFLGHILGLSDYGFGMWAGTAINDTSSVVVAAYSYSEQAGDFATIVKLTRVTLIIPICLFLVFYQLWVLRKQKAQNFSLYRIFPWFVLWFLVASGIRTLDWLPHITLPYLNMAAKFMIVVALTAIGLLSDLAKMFAVGIRPMMLGLVTWLTVAVSSLLIQVLTGQT